VKYWRAREGIESPTLGVQEADALSTLTYGRIAGLSLFGGNPATFECAALAL